MRSTKLPGQEFQDSCYVCDPNLSQCSLWWHSLQWWPSLAYMNISIGTILGLMAGHPRTPFHWPISVAWAKRILGTQGSNLFIHLSLAEDMVTCYFPVQCSLPFPSLLHFLRPLFHR